VKAEQIAQVNLMNWLAEKHPDVYKDTIHIANERQTSWQEGRILKKMGVKMGVADIFIAVPSARNGKCGLWIELKEGKNKPTPEQQEFLRRMNNRGYIAVCVWGWHAAKEIIETYLMEIEGDRNLQ
jgi:hypothetical protein